MSKIFGSTTAGIIILLLFAVVIALLVIMLNMNLRMSRLQKRYRLFMKGSDGQSVEKAMAGKMIELGKLRHGQEQTNKDIGELQHQYDKMLCKYGIVKYDAFEDVGGKMSFALAMLDQDNTGFVLNAIHSRDNCFLYLKDVVKGTSYIMLSDEEIEALRRAAKYGEDAAMEAKASHRKERRKAHASQSGTPASEETGAAPAAGNAAEEMPPEGTFESEEDLLFASASEENAELAELEQIIARAEAERGRAAAQENSAPDTAEATAAAQEAAEPGAAEQEQEETAK